MGDRLSDLQAGIESGDVGPTSSGSVGYESYYPGRPSISSALPGGLTQAPATGFTVGTSRTQPLGPQFIPVVPPSPQGQQGGGDDDGGVLDKVDDAADIGKTALKAAPFIMRAVPWLAKKSIWVAPAAAGIGGVGDENQKAELDQSFRQKHQRGTNLGEALGRRGSGK